MVQACMGSKLQKLMIAFRAYDLDGNEFIDKEQVKFISYHIHQNMACQQGVSIIHD